MNCANHPDREKVAFCQNCGKPLCQECTRVVGSAVFCEPCLVARLDSAGAVPPAPGAYTYNDPTSGVYASGTHAGGGTYTYNDPRSGVYASGVIPPHMRSGAPNPLLAGFLGFIPGVGAMYNEQYAKGIVHLIVFAILVSLADSNGIFGLLVAGWEFYMAIEAHHTARARRDGLPLPNPFGLNDLGERLGFGKSWAGGSPASGAASGAAPWSSPGTVPGTAAGSVPVEPYTAPYGSAPGVHPGYPPYTPPYAAGAVPPGWATPPASGWEQYGSPIPPQNAVPPVPMDDHIPYPGNRFPAGALWLIGFGVLFLIGNAGFLHGVSTRLFLPFLLIGLAVFLFVRKMTSNGGGLISDGSAAYRYQIIRALRSSVWIALVGLLFFLDEFHILSWGHSWPLFIILAGVMAVLGRAAYNAAAAATPPYGAPYGYGYPPQPAAAAPTTSSPGSSIVPSATNEREES